MLNKNRFKNLRTVKNSSSDLVEAGDNYTVTFDNRDIYITGFIDTVSMQTAIETINSINKADNFEARNFAVLNSEYNAPPINLYINSPGGDVVATLGLITTIESSETEVHTHCIGEACSAALLIFSVGHQRYAYKHSIFMYHQLSTMALGTFKDIEDAVEILKHLQERLEEIFLTYTKFTAKELAEIRQSKRDHTFYYQEALDKGLADKVIISAIYTKDLQDLKDNSNISITTSEGEPVESESTKEESLEINSIEVDNSIEVIKSISNKDIEDLEGLSYEEALAILKAKSEK